MFVAGLTGGIASGKSTVSQMFAEAGATVIDADEIAHAIVEPGLPAWASIRDTFGTQILLPDNRIDRQRLGDIVFHDPAKRRVLEGIIHPGVRKAIDARMHAIARKMPDAVVIQDIPLLYESGMTQGLDEIIVVYIPESLQLQRLMRRDGLSSHAAGVRIASQLSLEQKRRKATIIIDNANDQEQTRRQVLQLYARFEQRSRKSSG